MRVTLTHTRQISFETDDATVTWRAAASRRFGDCLVTIRRDSPGWDAHYVNDQGGSMIQIEDTAGGTWTGYADVPTSDESGLTLHGYHLANLTQHNTVGFGRKVQCASAGAIAAACARAACSGPLDGILRPGTFVEQAPPIANFGFNGQDLATAMGTLMDLSGQEWEVTEAGILNWLPCVGNLIDYLFVDGAIVRNTTREADRELQVSQVIARGNTGEEFLAALSPEATLLQRQEVVSVNTNNLSTLARHAFSQLRQRGVLPHIWRCEIDRQTLVGTTSTTGIQPGEQYCWGHQGWGCTPWGASLCIINQDSTGLAIREGDILRILVPYQGFAGETIYARVMSRTIVGGYGWVALELVELPDTLLGDGVMPLRLLNPSGDAPRLLTSLSNHIRNAQRIMGMR